MYRKPSPQMTIDDFILPFAGKLAADNRWVKLAGIIPWDEIEKQYAFMFPSDRGNVAKPVRMALGALIIQTRCGFTDRETVQQITENPYLQYFIGLKEYQLTRPFTPAAMVKFRKRFNAKRLADINEKILQAEKSKQELETEQDEDRHDNDSGGSGNLEEKSEMSEAEVIAEADARPNQGTLILDATCTPADISFPTDHRLLNEAREQLDKMIDTLHQTDGKGTRRPRTYRQKARKDYLSLSKQRNPRKNQIRKAIKKQLQYVRRNLKVVEQMLMKAAEQNELNPLSQRQEKLLTVIRKLYEQQAAMYKNRSHRISDRIVNLYQSHVRPIVRGKAGAAVEFGAKVAISLEDGYSRIEKLAWDSFNEAGTLEETVERYRERHGCYPEAVLADKIYRNRDNLLYCKKHRIRLSGPRLGRPPASSTLQKVEKRLEKLDAKQRNAVEGKFGEGKRKYSLARVVAKLKETAECMIAMQFLVMNLEHKLRVLFIQIWIRLFLQRFETVSC